MKEKYGYFDENDRLVTVWEDKRMKKNYTLEEIRRMMRSKKFDELRDEYKKENPKKPNFCTWFGKKYDNGNEYIKCD